MVLLTIRARSRQLTAQQPGDTATVAACPPSRPPKQWILWEVSYCYGICLLPWSLLELASASEQCLLLKPSFLSCTKPRTDLNHGKPVRRMLHATFHMLSFVVCSLRYSFESNVGLSFLGAGIGNVLGSLVSGHVSDCLIKKARARRGGLAKTEDRLTLNAWYMHIYLLAASLRIYANHQTRPGGYIIVPMGVLLFGWSVYLQWTVWVSIVAFGTVCFGMSQGMVSCVTFAQLLLTANSNQKQYLQYTLQVLHISWMQSQARVHQSRQLPMLCGWAWLASSVSSLSLLFKL